MDGVTFASQYTYDPLDRLTALQYPSLHTAGYQYDAGGRLTAVTWLGQPFATLVYDDVETGRLTKYVTGPVTHEVTQDVRDRVHRLTVESPAAPDALHLDYTYDRSSLVTGITDPRPTHSQTFGYDTLGRLTQAQGAYGTLSWGYRANGDRLVETRSAQGASIAYDYNSANQLTATTGLAPATFSRTGPTAAR